MNIKQYLLKTLSNKELLELLPNKKVYFLHAISTEENPLQTPYVEYEIINEYGANYSEGQEEFTTYIVQVDIFSKDDFTIIEEIIKKNMINKEFNRDMCANSFEKNTQLNHCAMRFNISLLTSES
ncbi:prohead protease [Clostridium sp. MB40-C1]|uniref:prohead protease n=1 Tax=Clostridium sp. MB40-C1 TaxID=3070996 RepID=UPI0027E1ACA2|nr:prohead protease [Clostridium sp. MB40-C1]WMJ81972.1 prohead protease [Clostridium sp. MB40-C1]